MGNMGEPQSHARLGPLARLASLGQSGLSLLGLAGIGGLVRFPIELGLARREPSPTVLALEGGRQRKERPG